MVTVVKSFLFIIVVPGTVVFVVPWLIGTYGDAERLIYDSWRAVAVPLWVLGVAALFWCAWDFSRRGEGTPAPIDAPKKLVVHGLYRFVRNPMYVAQLTILLGQFLWFGSPWLLLYVACLFTGFHLFIVLYEEPTLRRLFGDAYTRYAEAVPRWLPRPTPYRPNQN